MTTRKENENVQEQTEQLHSRTGKDDPCAMRASQVAPLQGNKIQEQEKPGLANNAGAACKVCGRDKTLGEKDSRLSEFIRYLSEIRKSQEKTLVALGALSCEVQEIREYLFGIHFDD